MELEPSRLEAWIDLAIKVSVCAVGVFYLVMLALAIIK